MKRPQLFILIVLSVFAFAVSPGSASLGDGTVKTQGEQSKQSKRTIIGLVVDVSGKWHIENATEQKSLSSGEEVYEGWTLRRDSADGSIKLALVNKRSVMCPGQLRVGDVLSLTKFRHAKDSWWSTFLPMVSEEGGWVWSGCRVTDSCYLQDGIIKLQDGTLDLGSVMSALPDGAYVIKIVPMNANHSGAQEFAAIKSGAGASASQTITVEPGLYKMYVSAGRGTRLPHVPDNAIILVSAVNDYPSLNRLYRKAIKETVAYGALRPGTVRFDLLRAYLIALSKNQPETTLSKLR